jgi:tetratricopeptide (TPR) repeat protein
MRAGVAVAVVIAALLAAWSQWQPQRSVNASQDALDLLATNPRAALAQAQTAVSRDPLSAQALITLATIEQDTGLPALAQATLQRAVRLQPSNPQTWLALARHDLASEPAAAVKQLQAAIYLNPELIAAEAIAPPYPNPESVEIYNDYIQALRASAAVGVAGASRTGASVGAVGARGRSRGSADAIAGASTSAIARPEPAAAAARRAARRRRARRLLEIRAARAAG